MYLKGQKTTRCAGEMMRGKKKDEEAEEEDEEEEDEEEGWKKSDRDETYEYVVRQYQHYYSLIFVVFVACLAISSAW